MNYNDPELRQQLASEYALGLLRGAAAKRFERLLREDPELQRMVSEVHARYAPLLEIAPTEPPADHVWKKIEAQLFQQTALTGARIEKEIDSTRSWSTTLYKGWAAVATIALAVMLFQWPTTEPESEAVVTAPQVEAPDVVEPEIESPDAKAPMLIAVLSAAKTKQAAWLINIDLSEKELTAATLAPQPLDTDRVFELWVKLADRPTVDSLGLISADGVITLDLSEELASAIADSEFLGVSVEPPGGSPTGQPTTTPSYAGTIVKI